MRKMTPLYLALLDAAQKMRMSMPELGNDADLEAVGSKMSIETVLSFSPVADVLANMPDDHVRYIFKHCLSKAEVKQGEFWAPLLAPGAELVFMFPLTVTQLIGIAFNVVSKDLSSFFRTVQ